MITNSRLAEFSETTLPHLEITMNIDWQKIGATYHSAPNNFQDQTRRLAKISKRCGEDTLNQIIKFSRKNRVIDFPTLQSVQFYVLGKGATSFRTTSAFCSLRNERYAYFRDLPSLFKTKLEKDGVEKIHPLAKAARLYLDIIFVHPFIDGNARSAILAATTYCLKYNYAPPDIDELFSFEFSRPSEATYTDFSNLFARNVGGYA